MIFGGRGLLDSPVLRLVGVVLALLAERQDEHLQVGVEPWLALDLEAVGLLVDLNVLNRTALVLGAEDQTALQSRARPNHKAARWLSGHVLLRRLLRSAPPLASAHNRVARRKKRWRAQKKKKKQPRVRAQPRGAKLMATMQRPKSRGRRVWPRARATRNDYSGRSKARPRGPRAHTHVPALGQEPSRGAPAHGRARKVKPRESSRDREGVEGGGWVGGWREGREK